MRHAAHPDKTASRSGWFAFSYMLLVGGLVAGIAIGVVQSLSQPLLGAGDVNLWGYQGFYFWENLRFSPWPTLDLSNTTFGFPYETNQVFQPWGFERDYFVAGCLSVFGRGPWPQIYFLYSLIVLAVGAFLLLRREYGDCRAAFFGVAATFGNYYAHGWFPWAMHAACAHWTCLNIVADHLLVRRVASRNRVGWRFLLLRAALLVLALGQDLAYVAGFAFTSFTIHAAWCAAMVGARRVRGVRQPIISIQTGWSWISVAAIVAVLAAASFLYVPLIVQVSLKVRELPDVYQAPGWLHPGRMLIPVLPGLHPAQARFDPQQGGPKWFDDDAQGTFAGSPGAFFVLAGALGLVFVVRRRLFTTYAPVIVLLILCMTYDPGRLPTLQVFPWHRFSRIAERASVLNPTLLMILALAIPASFLRSRVGKTALVLGVALLGIETFTAYRESLTKPKDNFVPDDSFWAFMDEMRLAPGEGVLEWPFCVHAGNGVGSRLLGPYYRTHQNGIFALRQFHGKKSPNMYFGRVHPTQIEPYLLAGWHHLFAPDVEDEYRAVGQARDLTAQEWQFLTEMLAVHDYCGVILYTELLLPRTVSGFHERFGSPSAVTSFHMAGRMEFIPNRSRRAASARTETREEVAFVPRIEPGQRVDCTRPRPPYVYSGWYPPDADVRWFADEVVIRFRVGGWTPKALRLWGYTYGRQRVRVEFNGQELPGFVDPGGPAHEIRVDLPRGLLAESNTIRLGSQPVRKGKNDSRALWMAISWFDLPDS